ncbi:unnamed protein product [Schistocephalus solidus]|uniref:POP4 domain-containing protein n=1 Tax=Schistocephalus solidus TaxID=70667 RepID=A0A183T4W6_SCHSO|nr:unnamed protein product [Schistocephalus solidus]
MVGAAKTEHKNRNRPHPFDSGADSVTQCVPHEVYISSVGVRCVGEVLTAAVMAQYKSGECSCGRLYLVPNSHLWLLEVGFFPVATLQATVTTNGLNQVRGSGVLCAFISGLSDS